MVFLYLRLQVVLFSLLSLALFLLYGVHVVRLPLFVVLNGGDYVFLELTEFFAAFIFVFRTVCLFNWMFILVAALACYAVVCLVWSLILDD